MTKSLKNYAGRNDVDDCLIAELRLAGIKVEKMPECFREHSGEVKTIIIGSLHGWSFKRAWRYWICQGPGLPCDRATMLHSQFGAQVRVDGHCGCPSPLEWFHGLGCGHYHVDTLLGLKALSDAIKECVERANSIY